MRARPTALVVVALAALAGALPAGADEGTLPLRAGDAATGQLNRCGEAHQFETQLLRGERLKLRVTPDVRHPEAVIVRVFDPDGHSIDHLARTRSTAGVVSVGPFRAPDTGLHVIQLSTLSAHGTRYHVRSQVKRARKHTVRLRGRREAVTVRCAAGATLQVVRADDDAAVVVTDPAGNRSVWTADSPQGAALRREGLAIAEPGLYRFERGAPGDRLKLVVTSPRPVVEETVDFPAPPTTPAAGGWYWAGRWVPLAPAGGSAGGGTGGAREPSEDLRRSPAARTSERLDDTTAWEGPYSGAGLPLTLIPTLPEVTRDATYRATGAGPEYTFSKDVTGIGAVDVTVRFSVDGRPTPAPLDWGGRMAMEWTTSNADRSVNGQWTLSVDSVRGVRVLTGGEIWTDPARRRVTSTAVNFTTGGAGGWPQGDLRWTESDPLAGTEFVRTESHRGDGVVDLTLTRDEAGRTATTVDLR